MSLLLSYLAGSHSTICKKWQSNNKFPMSNQYSSTAKTCSLPCRVAGSPPVTMSTNQSPCFAGWLNIKACLKTVVKWDCLRSLPPKREVQSHRHVSETTITMVLSKHDSEAFTTASIRRNPKFGLSVLGSRKYRCTTLQVQRTEQKKLTDFHVDI